MIYFIKKSRALFLYLLINLMVISLACGMRQRTQVRPAPDSKVKNESVFRTNEDAVKAGIYEEFTDSLALKGSQPLPKSKPSAPTPAPSVNQVQPEQKLPAGVTMGFRVQLGAYNDEVSAEELAARARTRLPGNITVYVRYYAPYWKVHAGDCANRDEAERLNSVIKRNGFPDAWIVSAGINK